MTPPRPPEGKHSPCEKHYFTGGAIIKVQCMMCNTQESRSINYPDETHAKLVAALEEISLQYNLKSETREKLEALLREAAK